MKKKTICFNKFIVCAAICCCLIFMRTSAAYAQQDSVRNDTTQVFNATNNLVKVDEKLIISVAVDSGAHTQQLLMYGVRIHDKRLLGIKIYTGQATVWELNEGDLLTLMLDGGQEMLLFCNAPSRSDFSINGSETIIDAGYKLSSYKEQVLINSKVTGIRLECSGGAFVFNLNDEQADLVRSILMQIR